MIKITYKNNVWCEVVPVALTGYEEHLFKIKEITPEIQAHIDLVKQKIQTQSTVELDSEILDKVLDIIKKELVKETLDQITMLESNLMFDPNNSILVGVFRYSEIEEVEGEEKEVFKQKDFKYKKD